MKCCLVKQAPESPYSDGTLGKRKMFCPISPNLSEKHLRDKLFPYNFCSCWCIIFSTTMLQ